MEGVNQRRKRILWSTPKAHVGQAGRRREQRSAEEAGQHGEGGRGRSVGPGGPKGRMGRLAAGPVGPKAEKNPFRIKIRFLNLPRLWKFIEGDLFRILTQGFFLNSSRLLKDFKKIQ
jgi:hypothetical protein